MIRIYFSMAAFHSLSHSFPPLSSYLPLSRHTKTLVKSAANQNPNPTPTEKNNPEPDRFDLKKRPRKSEILRERRSPTYLEAAEPPNLEIGWKRTKEINLTRPKGFVIADFLEKLEGLMGHQYGSTELLAKAGGIVAERAREEAEFLREGGEVEQRLITELFRVLKLMEMDLEMVKAAVKEETLKERLDVAKARCRQAILVANSF